MEEKIKETIEETIEEKIKQDIEQIAQNYEDLRIMMRKIKYFVLYPILFILTSYAIVLIIAMIIGVIK